MEPVNAANESLELEIACNDYVSLIRNQKITESLDRHFKTVIYEQAIKAQFGPDIWDELNKNLSY